MSTNPATKKCAGHHAKQPGRQPWYYRGNVLDNIKALEADGQPWVIAKYRSAARFVAVDSVVAYELVIFQTYESEEAYDTLTMTRDEFHDAMAAMGLPLKPRYESPFGRVFGRDDRLRDIVRKWQTLDAGRAETERRLFARYTRAGIICNSHPGDEAMAAERTAARIAYKTAVAERASAKAAFLKENRITLYNF